MSLRERLESTPSLVVAGMPENVGAFSPTETTLLNWPAKTGLATRARTAALRIILRIGCELLRKLGWVRVGDERPRPGGPKPIRMRARAIPCGPPATDSLR